MFWNRTSRSLTVLQKFRAGNGRTASQVSGIISFIHPDYFVVLGMDISFKTVRKTTHALGSHLETEVFGTFPRDSCYGNSVWNVIFISARRYLTILFSFALFDQKVDKNKKTAQKYFLSFFLFRSLFSVLKKGVWK